MIGNTRVVMVGGMKRSGSTWIFNVARIALETIGHTYHTHPGLRELKRYSGGADYLIVKSHWWTESAERLSDIVLTSVRDVDEVRASLSRFGRKPPSDEEMDKIIGHFERWNAVADYCMNYQDLVERPLIVVENLLEILGGTNELAPHVLEIVNSIKPPSDGHKDPDTLYFVNHITAPR